MDNPIIISQISLQKGYAFMYENFVVSSQQNLFLLLEENDGQIDALQFNFKIYKYGYPNDEAAHPLHKYGLGFYGLYEVNNSDWIKELRDNNKQHPMHDDALYNSLKHYIAKFKDVTLEVICTSMKEMQLTKEQLLFFLKEQIEFLKQ